MFSERDVDFILYAAEHPNDSSVIDQWKWMNLAYRRRLAEEQRNAEQLVPVVQHPQSSVGEHP